MSIRKLVFAVSAAVVAAALVTFSTGGSALAKPGYAKVSSLNSPTGFSEPVGVGVDNSLGLDRGDVYVSDKGSGELDQFSPTGTFLGQVAVPSAGLTGLTVDSFPGLHEGDVYIAGWESGVIYRFTPGLGSKEEFIKGLSQPMDVTIDEAGDIFVAERVGQLLEFNSSGEPINASGSVVASGENVLATLSGDAFVGVAIDPTGTRLYASTYSNGTLQYNFSGGTYVEANAPLDRFSSGQAYPGVSIDPGGLVDTVQQVTNWEGVPIESIGEFEPSGQLVTNIESGGLPGFSEIGVSAESGAMYVVETYNNSVAVYERGELDEPTTEPYSELHGSTVTFNGSLGGNEIEYRFTYVEGPACPPLVAAGPNVSTATVAASGPQKVHVEVTELQPHKEYSYCLVSTNRYGSRAGATVSFETGAVQPRIASGSVSPNIQSANVSAQINPEESYTVYEVEYGTSLPYTNRSAELFIAPGSAYAAVNVPLTGLTPDTLYHYRVVASNEAGTTQSADRTFATYPPATSRLPDHRAYEVVSPIDNPYQAEVYEVNSGLLNTDVPFQASVDGDSVVYAGYPSTGGTGGSGETVGQQYLAKRLSGGGWTQVNVTPPGGAPFEEFVGFSNDLTEGVIPSETVAPLYAVQDLSTRSSREENRFEVPYVKNFGGGLYVPLFTVAPPNRLAESVTFLGTLTNGFETFYDGAALDFKHLFFEANDALVEGDGEAERELRTIAMQESEQMKEATRLNREQIESGRREQLERISNHFALYESSGGRVSLVNILPDGKLAVGATFGSATAPKRFFHHQVRYQPDLSGVISRDGSRVFWSGASPHDVYVRENGSRTVQVSAGRATYWTASPDGRYGYYTENGELWRFDVESEAREQITPEGSEVRAALGPNQSGEDGAYVYFVSLRNLTGEEENAEKAKPEEGQDNLYVSEPDPAHPGQHVTRFIAALTYEDESDWARSLGGRTFAISGDGRSAVFESTSNLTGHPYPSEGSEEVYEYRADKGRLFCVSCRPQASGGFFEPTASAVQMRRWVSEDGDRVFFESEAPLVEQDANGARDVYEWEPDGTGVCAEAEGCLYLLTGGIEATAFFADASVSGNDVFIATRQHLLPEDEDELVHLYDARVDGVRAVTPPECSGTGCQGPPAQAPIFATPASVTFNGLGNFAAPSPATKPQAKGRPRSAKQKLLAQCRKQRGKSRRHRCEARARKRYGAKTGKSANKGTR